MENNRIMQGEGCVLRPILKVHAFLSTLLLIITLLLFLKYINFMFSIVANILLITLCIMGHSMLNPDNILNKKERIYINYFYGLIIAIPLIITIIRHFFYK